MIVNSHISSRLAAERERELLADAAGVAISRAGEADRAALLRLSVVDVAPVPQGDVLIARVDGEAWAAIEVDSGVTVADPFRPSAHVVDMLRARASRLRTKRERRRRSWLRWPAASHLAET